MRISPDTLTYKNCFENNSGSLQPKHGFKNLHYKAHEEISFHSKGCHSILFLKKGALSICMDGVNPVDFTIPHMFLIPESTQVEIHAFSNIELLVLSFDEYLPVCKQGEVIDFTQFIPSVAPREFVLPLDSRFMTYLETIDDVLALGTFCNVYHSIKIQEFFFLISAYYNPIEVATLFYPLLDKKFKFKSFIYKNYLLIESVDELADKSGLSRTVFFEEFKEVFGASVKQWLIQKKADSVRSRLLEPNASIKEVMLDLNFSSASQFNRFCRTYLGDSPSNFIKKNAN